MIKISGPTEFYQYKFDDKIINFFSDYHKGMGCINDMEDKNVIPIYTLFKNISKIEGKFLLECYQDYEYKIKPEDYLPKSCEIKNVIKLDIRRKFEQDLDIKIYDRIIRFFRKVKEKKIFLNTFENIHIYENNIANCKKMNSYNFDYLKKNVKIPLVKKRLQDIKNLIKINYDDKIKNINNLLEINSKILDFYAIDNIMSEMIKGDHKLFIYLGENHIKKIIKMFQISYPKRFKLIKEFTNFSESKRCLTIDNVTYITTIPLKKLLKGGAKKVKKKKNKNKLNKKIQKELKGGSWGNIKSTCPDNHYY